MNQNKLYERLRQLNSGLSAKVDDCIKTVTLYLDQYKKNFPDYTDHSIEHTSIVASNASDILTQEELDNLNGDEIYILLIACYLHDIGMCINDQEIDKLKNSSEFIKRNKVNPQYLINDYLRDIHHELSEKFINERWQDLHIENGQYAKRIGLIAKAHRVVNLGNFNEYKPKDFVQPHGREYVCMPYLGCIIRIADEMDITNMRTPELLFKDYLPENVKSKTEWIKHKSTFGANISDDTIVIRAETDDQNIYDALIKQAKKIEDVLRESQKVISFIPTTDRKFSLKLKSVETADIKPVGFIPKNIGFSYDLNSIFNTFIGKNLYPNHFIAIRESLQNAIDTCRLRAMTDESYKPIIRIELKKDCLVISDNGMGMNEFIVRNYFGKLGASFYKSESIAPGFNSIGTFGVGIFSYFLMCDHFDIETKANDNDTLRFKVIKDSSSNFYFYKNTFRNDSGSTLTIYFNREFDFEKNNIEEIIKHYVPFLEIPILIVSNGKEKEIKTKEELIFDPRLKLEESIIFEYRQELNKIHFIDSKMDNDDFEGEIGVHISFSEDGKLSPIGIINKINHRNNYSVRVTQKGIFVNYQQGNFFNSIVGYVNLKKGLELNLNRTSFSEHSHGANKFIFKFENEILLKIIDKWRSLSLQTQYGNFNNLIYTFNINFITKKIASTVIENFILKVYKDGNYSFLLIKDLLKSNCFLFYEDYRKSLSSEHHPNKRCANIDDLWQKYKIPIVDFTGTRTIDFYFIMFSLLYQCKLKNFDYIGYLEVDTKAEFHQTRQIILDKNYKGLSTMYRNQSYTNDNHPFFQFINQSNNKNIIDIAEAISRMFHSLSFTTNKPTDCNNLIQDINSKLKLINDIANTNFSIDLQDFQGDI